MAGEAVMLAKGFKALPKKHANLKGLLPGIISEKIDGGGIDIFGDSEHYADNRTRQWERYISIPHICEALNWLRPTQHVYGELHCYNADGTIMPFAKSSGIIRRHKPDTNIYLGVFDYFDEDSPDDTYVERLRKVKELFDEQKVQDPAWHKGRIFIIPYKVVRTLEEYKVHHEEIMQRWDNVEGTVFRAAVGDVSKYRAGVRSWGLLRNVPEPMVDLEVLGIEEATANKHMQFMGEWYEQGQGLGCLGKFVCKFNGKTVKPGPGTMSHIERVAVWQAYCADPSTITGSIIKVKYKRDATYKALRQPLFYDWHHDKREQDETLD